MLCSVLLFEQGQLLKLCDFGTAKKLEHTLTNAVGTIRYMAPEVIRGRGRIEIASNNYCNITPSVCLSVCCLSVCLSVCLRLPPTGRYYTPRCDVFSFGIVVWEMITRKRPILGSTAQQSNMAILYAMANGMWRGGGGG